MLVSNLKKVSLLGPQGLGIQGSTPTRTENVVIQKFKRQKSLKAWHYFGVTALATKLREAFCMQNHNIFVSYLSLSKSFPH